MGQCISLRKLLRQKLARSSKSRESASPAKSHSPLTQQSSSSVPTAVTSSREASSKKKKAQKNQKISKMVKKKGGSFSSSILELKRGERIGKWIILGLVGEGRFGCVYKVGYHGKRYALKFHGKSFYDDFDEDPATIERQVLALAKRAHNKHFCEMFDFGIYSGYQYIVMSLLGKSLRYRQDLVKFRAGRKLSPGCVISVGLQCMQAIEELHRIGFIHRDIKPSNFVTGASEQVNGARKIFLIDFGFSYQYVDWDDRIKQPKHSVHFKGTLRYAPIACHQRKPPGRRDDLESWMYQQIELTKGSLPWKNLDEDEEILDAKIDARSKDGMRKLLRMCPNSYKVLMIYIGNLRQISKPDYDLIYKTLRKTLFESHLKEYPYDWECGSRRPLRF